MRFTSLIALRLGAALAVLAAPAAALATVEISIGPQDPFQRDITARARWGGSGYEANLRSDGADVLGTQMNPVGAPVWNMLTGTTTWQIDFNRDGSFSASETSSFVKPSRINYSFEYIEMAMWSQTNGNNASGLDVSNLTINGTSLGNFSQSGNTPQTVWFQSTTGFENIDITGQFSFLRLSGSGNSVFAQERPKLEFSFVGPVYIEPVPEPAAWAMLVLGFGLVGARSRRRTRALSA